LWQEWYAKLDGGKWGWLAEAQGRYYLTFEEPLPPETPAFEAIAPGMRLAFPVRGTARTFTVSEHAGAAYVAASGELPYRLVPDGSFRFVDLDDGAGTFGTLDYGDTGDAPALYIGHQVTLAELGISGGEDAPSREPSITSKRLACPSCNAPIELRVPGETQRVVCSYCNELIAVGDAVQVLGKLKVKATPSIPLGSNGTFADGELTVIGYVQRSAHVDDVWYPFEEYLMYAPGVGFRWLVCSDGHWSYVQPVAVGAIEQVPVRYDGVKFLAFARAPLRVDVVLGEFYWQVAEGEQVESEDFVAPPAMLSLERSAAEETWSLSTYMTEREVQRALGDKDLVLPPRIGKGPNQVNPGQRAARNLTFGMLLMMLMGLVASFVAPNRLAYEHSVPVVGGGSGSAPPAVPVGSDAGSDAGSAAGSAAGSDAGSAAPPEGQNVFFSDPFELDGSKNVELDFSTQLDNDWMYVAADLVHDKTGGVVNLEANLEHWSGVEDGESWSEGSQQTTEVVGPQPEGSYLLRLESQRGLAGEATLHVVVRQGVYRLRYLLWALAILGVPWLVFGVYAWAFEKQRWENSTEGKAPTTAFGVMFALVAGIGILVWVLIKAFARSSSDD
jgi:hypothetical protein